jgi:hypothetical protein
MMIVMEKLTAARATTRKTQIIRYSRPLMLVSSKLYNHIRYFIAYQ